MSLIVPEPLPAMGVPLPTASYVVRRPGEEPGAAFVGHASRNRAGTERTLDGRVVQAAAWSIVLDAGAWPVTESCLLEDEDGQVYRVRAAQLRRGATGALGHVAVQADTVSSDPSSDGAVDDDGNVEEVPA